MSVGTYRQCSLLCFVISSLRRFHMVMKTICHVRNTIWNFGQFLTENIWCQSTLIRITSNSQNFWASYQTLNVILLFKGIRQTSQIIVTAFPSPYTMHPIPIHEIKFWCLFDFSSNSYHFGWLTWQSTFLIISEISYQYMLS